MVLDFEKVRNVILEELRERGYAPNSSDVTVAAQRIIELSKEAERETIMKEKEMAATRNIPSPPSKVEPPSE